MTPVRERVFFWLTFVNIRRYVCEFLFLLVFRVGCGN